MKHTCTIQSRISYLLLAVTICFATPQHTASRKQAWQKFGPSLLPVLQEFGPPLLQSGLWSTIILTSGFSHIISILNQQSKPYYVGLWGTWGDCEPSKIIQEKPLKKYHHEVIMAKAGITCAAAVAYHGLPLWQSYKSTGFSKRLFVPVIEAGIGCLVLIGLLCTRFGDDKHFFKHPTIHRTLATAGNVYSYTCFAQRAAPHAYRSFRQALPYGIGFSLLETALMCGAAKAFLPSNPRDFTLTSISQAPDSPYLGTDK